jgi:hypothetical protein
MPRKAITAPDIQFLASDTAVVRAEKLNRLMRHVRALTGEHEKHAKMLDGGSEDQVLVKNSSDDFDADWQDPA